MCRILSQLPSMLLITGGLLIDGVILRVKQVNNWNRPRIWKFPPTSNCLQKTIKSLARLVGEHQKSIFQAKTRCRPCFIGNFVQLAQLGGVTGQPTSLTRLQRKKWGGWAAADQPVEANSFSRAEAAFLDESDFEQRTLLFTEVFDGL